MPRKESILAASACPSSGSENQKGSASYINSNGDRLSHGKSDLPKDLGKGGGMPWLGGLFWRPGFVEGINLGKPTAGAGEAPWRLPLELKLAKSSHTV